MECLRSLYVLLCFLGLSPNLFPQNLFPQTSPIVKSEFIFTEAPFKSSHGSTIVETRVGLVAAWFGGTREGAPDVGIWLSRQVGGRWTPPIEVANGTQQDGRRYPCWNPVLFERRDGVLLLFYPVGPHPSRWWGVLRSSTDQGLTWGDAQRLPDRIMGAAKNKPVQLQDGSLLSPSWTESTDSPSKWRVHFEKSVDGGKTWTIIAPPEYPPEDPYNAIEPSILVHRDGRLQSLGRTRSGYIFETWSNDEGRSWTPLKLLSLPNPNSGTDAITLRDGRQLLVYNHTNRGRSPLNVSISHDGEHWEAALVLESTSGEYSYPFVIQTRDGLVHVTYTWKRKHIKHVVIDPAKLKSVPMPDGQWPAANAGLEPFDDETSLESNGVN